jgi:hypothetical protein
MNIVIKCSDTEYAQIMKHSRRGIRGEDAFDQIRTLFCYSHDDCECERWESCRDCLLNNINWEVKKS